MSGKGLTRLSHWEDVELERLNPLLERRIITGRRVMLAHVHLKKGCVVPLHSHENEQLSYVLRGELHFWVGSEETEPVRVREGAVLHLPSNVPHKVEALQDSLSLDVFSPPREDWLTGQDDYLRGK